MKKVLITGISGFVGKNVEAYLSDDYTIVGFGRNSANNYEDFQISECFCVLHLAGKAHDLKQVAIPSEYYQANTELTKKIFDAFLNSDAEKFIFFSSVKAVKDNVIGVLKEEDEQTPKTDYGKSKQLAEQYILENLPQNKKVYILRPCMIHGEYNKGNLNLLYNLIKNNIPYPLGAFENQRSFLGIKNLCFIIKELIDRNDIPSGIYHLADNETISTKDLALLIGKIINKKVWVLNISKNIVQRMALIGDTLKLPFNTERLNKMTENYIVSNNKIKKILGVELPFSCFDGLTETIKSFRK